MLQPSNTVPEDEAEQLNKKQNIVPIQKQHNFTQRKNPKNSPFQSYLLLSQFNSQNVKLHTHILAEFLFWEQWTIQKEIKKKYIYI